jgi:alcohol dehydrogenase class IV
MLVGEKMKELGGSRIMVICDQVVRATGIIDPIVKSLKDAGLSVEIFDKVLPDPPDYVYNEGGELAKKNKIDGIVAVGGGSSMDTAKGVNILINNDLPISKYYRVAADAIKGAPVPLICIPTTSGTGSEMTYIAVVTDTENQGFKQTLIAASHTVPKLCIIDPEVSIGMPYIPSVCCALDVMAHCIDSIIHKKAEPFSGSFAQRGISLVVENLPLLESNMTDVKLRENLALAANMGGTAIMNAMCHLSHAAGHTLGSIFHIPHGIACFLVLPQLLKRYAKWMPEETKTVAKAWGLNPAKDVTTDQLGDLMHDTALNFMKTVKAPTFTDLKMERAKVIDAAAFMINDLANGNSPAPKFDAKDYADLMAEAYDEYH